MCVCVCPCYRASPQDVTKILEQLKDSTEQELAQHMETIKTMQTESKVIVALAKKSMKTFSGLITKFVKKISKDDKRLVTPGPANLEISAESSNLVKLFYNMGLVVATAQGFNLKPDLSEDKVARLQLDSSILKALVDKDTYFKTVEKAINAHLQKHDLQSASTVVPNSAKADAWLTTLEVPAPARQKWSFPPSAQTWSRPIFSINMWKSMKGYEYVGAVHMAVGEGRLVCRGSEWWVGIKFAAVLGEDFEAKYDFIRKSTWEELRDLAKKSGFVAHLGVGDLLVLPPGFLLANLVSPEGSQGLRWGVLAEDGGKTTVDMVTSMLATYPALSDHGYDEWRKYLGDGTSTS